MLHLVTCKTCWTDHISMFPSFVLMNFGRYDRCDLKLFYTRQVSVFVSWGLCTVKIFHWAIDLTSCSFSGVITSAAPVSLKRKDSCSVQLHPSNCHSGKLSPVMCSRSLIPPHSYVISQEAWIQLSVWEPSRCPLLDLGTMQWQPWKRLKSFLEGSLLFCHAFDTCKGWDRPRESYML